MDLGQFGEFTLKILKPKKKSPATTATKTSTTAATFVGHGRPAGERKERNGGLQREPLLFHGFSMGFSMGFLKFYPNLLGGRRWLIYRMSILDG